MALLYDNTIGDTVLAGAPSVHIHNYGSAVFLIDDIIFGFVFVGRLSFLDRVVGERDVHDIIGRGYS